MQSLKVGILVVLGAVFLCPGLAKADMEPGELCIVKAEPFGFWEDFNRDDPNYDEFPPLYGDAPGVLIYEKLASGEFYRKRYSTLRAISGATYVDAYTPVYLGTVKGPVYQGQMVYWNEVDNDDDIYPADITYVAGYRTSDGLRLYKEHPNYSPVTPTSITWEIPSGFSPTNFRFWLLRERSKELGFNFGSGNLNSASVSEPLVSSWICTTWFPLTGGENEIHLECTDVDLNAYAVVLAVEFIDTNSTTDPDTPGAIMFDGPGGEVQEIIQGSHWNFPRTEQDNSCVEQVGFTSNDLAVRWLRHDGTNLIDRNDNPITNPTLTDLNDFGGAAHMNVHIEELADGSMDIGDENLKPEWRYKVGSDEAEWDCVSRQVAKEITLDVDCGIYWDGYDYGDLTYVHTHSAGTMEVYNKITCGGRNGEEMHIYHAFGPMGGIPENVENLSFGDDDWLTEGLWMKDDCPNDAGDSRYVTNDVELDLVRMASASGNGNYEGTDTLYEARYGGFSTNGCSVHDTAEAWLSGETEKLYFMPDAFGGGRGALDPDKKIVLNEDDYLEFGWSMSLTEVDVIEDNYNYGFSTPIKLETSDGTDTGDSEFSISLDRYGRLSEITYGNQPGQSISSINVNRDFVLGWDPSVFYYPDGIEVEDVSALTVFDGDNSNETFLVYTFPDTGTVDIDEENVLSADDQLVLKVTEYDNFLEFEIISASGIDFDIALCNILTNNIESDLPDIIGTDAKQFSRLADTGPNGENLYLGMIAGTESTHLSAKANRGTWRAWSISDLPEANYKRDQKFALFVCEESDLEERIKELEEHFSLNVDSGNPASMAYDVKEDPANNLDYLFVKYNSSCDPLDSRDVIKTCREMGIQSVLLHQACWYNMAHGTIPFGPWTDRYSDYDQNVETFINHLREAGLLVGAHTFLHKLKNSGYFPNEYGIASDDPGDIDGYTNFLIPYGEDWVYEIVTFDLESMVDPDPEDTEEVFVRLPELVAEKFADRYNTLGFDWVYFDGAEDTQDSEFCKGDSECDITSGSFYDWSDWYAVPRVVKAASLHMDRPPRIIQASYGAQHMWHYISRKGQDDYMYDSIGGILDGIVNSIPGIKRNLQTPDLGWFPTWYPRGGDQGTIPVTPEEVEALCDVSLIHNAPIGIMTKLTGDMTLEDEEYGGYTFDREHFISEIAKTIKERRRKIYVDMDNNIDNGARDGTSWGKAYATLQKALKDAQTGDEIWVANGTYYPHDDCPYRAENPSYDVKQCTFKLKDNVGIYGGFKGYSAGRDAEFLREQRDPENYETVLSGEIDGDGILDAGNSYQVVDASDTYGLALLDSVTITRGYANGVDSADQSGGGIYMKNGGASFVRCKIIENYAIANGGGVATAVSSPSETIPDGRPTRSTPLFANCLVADNSCGGNGGGMYRGDCSSSGGWSVLKLVNCTIVDNTASGVSGGIFSNDDGTEEGMIDVVNTIIWGNTDGYAGATESDQIKGEDRNKLVVSYSCIQNWSGSELDIVVSNPNFLLGEYTFEYDQSPCADAGLDDAVYDESDLATNPRIDADYVDIGAYESVKELFSLDITLIYVDGSATSSAETGDSWADAYLTLDDALDAVSGLGEFEIRVAKGTYYPGTSQTDSFEMINGVIIVGGYAGLSNNSNNPDERDIVYYETILTGDVDNDGTSDRYHVFYNDDVDNTAVLDGVTITKGNANNGNNGSTRRGGGMYNINSSPILIDCTFKDNEAALPSVGLGGGMYNHASSPLLKRCVFLNNAADYGGGMQSTSNCSPTLINCLFYDNVARRGAAIDIAWSSSLEAINCTVSDNNANQVGGRCGGLHLRSESTATVTNSILWGNIDYDSTSTNTQLHLDDVNSSITVTYSCIQDSWAGTENISVDPDFLTGSYVISFDSPCIDEGNDDAVPSSVQFDLAGSDRFVDGDYDYNAAVDMGAYEFIDCNDNGIYDPTDIASGVSRDGNGDGILNECDVWGVLYVDASANDEDAN